MKTYILNNYYERYQLFFLNRIKFQSTLTLIIFQERV